MTTPRVAVLVVVMLAFAAYPHAKKTAALQQAQEPVQGKLENFRPTARTIDQIRKSGAIGNLNQGLQIRTNNVSTRLVAWPGIGVAEAAIHVLTLKPGDKTGWYSYPVSEEALVCVRGTGIVHLRGKPVTMKTGDVAYYPEGVSHYVENPPTNTKDFVLVAQITPPQLALYPMPYFNADTGKFDYEKIRVDAKKAPLGKLEVESLYFHDCTYPELRPWNLTNDQIRKEGALFQLLVGARFTGLDVPMVIVLFPGFGTRNAGLHTGQLSDTDFAALHTHPISDDVIMQLEGSGTIYIDGAKVTIGPLDVAIAPVLAPHGSAKGPATRRLQSGFGSPPQQELYMYEYLKKNGQYVRPAEFFELGNTKPLKGPPCVIPRK